MKRECVICPKSFNSVNGRKVCSDKCYVERRRRQGRVQRKRTYVPKVMSRKRCAGCPKTFDAYRDYQRFCGDKCRRKSQRKRRKRRHCDNEACGRKFQPRTSQRFCRPTCREHVARLKRYGLDQARFKQLNTGRCGICDTTKPRGREGFFIDHDHACCPGDRSCGACVMWLACNHCNLRHFDDDVTLIRRFADLLDAHRSSRTEAHHDDNRSNYRSA